MREKSKKINKGLKEIYVPKFKRYFDSNYSNQEQLKSSIQCDHCARWRTVDQSTIHKYSKRKFVCTMIALKCK